MVARGGQGPKPTGHYDILLASCMQKVPWGLCWDLCNRIIVSFESNSIIMLHASCFMYVPFSCPTYRITIDIESTYLIQHRSSAETLKSIRFLKWLDSIH
jgi:hypothetical protein